MMTEVNCTEMCQSGCVLGDQCPHREYTEQASKFISDTSLDDMLALAEEAVRKKNHERMIASPQWVFPEE